MKRWMIKKMGTLVLSTATGIGFLSTAALGQDPLSESNELQRRLAELFEREGRPTAASDHRSSQPNRPAETLQEKAKSSQSTEDQTPRKNRKKGQRAVPVPTGKPAGIQAPVSGQSPPVTSEKAAPSPLVITPRESPPEAEPAPPVPAIRANSEKFSDDLEKSGDSSAGTAPPEQRPSPFETHPLAESKEGDNQETQSSAKTHPLDEQDAPDKPTFELPELAETAPEEDTSEKEGTPPAFTPTFELPSEFTEAEPAPKARPEKHENADVVIKPAFASPPSAKPASGNDGADPAINPFENGRRATSVKSSVEIKPAQTTQPKTPEPSFIAKNREKGPGLGGCCPVTLRDRRQVVPGRSEHSSRWQGVAYRFSSHRAKRKFDANPEKYAPANAGCDVTHIADSGEEKAGSLEHAVWYQRRLYLFQNPAARRAFSENPEKYVE